MEKNYISMAEMSKICPYDKEYLSLLARQGKLKAEKIGKKWFTQIEWVNEYLKGKKPGEEVAQNVEPDFSAKKIKFDYSWILFGVSVLFLILSFFIYQRVDSKLSELESKTTALQYQSKKENSYSINFQSVTDFFSSDKMEF
jgi:hypothetical protein